MKYAGVIRKVNYLCTLNVVVVNNLILLDDKVVIDLYTFTPIPPCTLLLLVIVEQVGESRNPDAAT